jgi:tRNA (cmo5U34)-methyltransferase
MLERAVQRIRPATKGDIATAQTDIRHLPLQQLRFDIIFAAAVFHHLRTDNEWKAVFAKCYAALKPGGSMWIADLIEHSTPSIQTMMWRRYGEYLAQVKDSQYRDDVFAYIEREDTPRPLLFQIDLLREVGFHSVEILHKNSCFAAFGALK